MAKTTKFTDKLKILNLIYSTINFKNIRSDPRWFFGMHLPHKLRCVLELIYKPTYRNIYYNVRIYDGLTRNDFYKGALIRFLHKLSAVDQPNNYDDDDGRGYFIGCKEDD